jgi:hypothetical protein
MATLEPQIQKGPRLPANPHQAPATIIENPAAATVAQALKNSAAQVDRAK